MTRTKQASLYPRKSPVPSKAKTVAFNYDKDILCKIEYDDDVPLPTGTHPLVAVYNITGVADFAKETESKGLGKPKVHLSFALDSRFEFMKTVVNLYDHTYVIYGNVLVVWFSSIRQRRL